MKFATTLKSLLMLTAVALLAACGGGTSGGDSAFMPATLRISATPTATSVQASQYIDVSVRVTQANGANVADGTQVQSTVTPGSNGVLQSIRDGALGSSTGITVGGIANFRFTAFGPGGSTALTFSVTDAASPSRSTSTTTTVNVTPAPDISWRIAATPGTTTLAARTSTDVTVRVTRADGSLVPDGTIVNATTIPASSGHITEVASTVGGVARFTYTAGATAGSSTARFSTTDPDSPSTVVTTEVNFTITEGPRYIIQATPVRTSLPAHTSTDVTVTVRNADGSQVVDGTMVNAVATPQNSGFVHAVDGGAPNVTTVAGIAKFTFTAGASAGTSTATFSVADPDDASQTSKVEVVFTITDGPSLLIDIQPAATSVRMQSRTDVTVRVRTAEGALVADGTVVSAVVVPESRGLAIGAQSNTPTVTTVGGVANFVFISGNQVGAAEVQFSVINAATDEVVTKSVTFNITAQTGRRMTVELLPSTIPLNGRTDIRIEVLEADGRPVADGTVVNAIAFPSSYGALDKTTSETLAGLAVFQYQAQSSAGMVDMVFSATTGDAENQRVVGRARLQIAPTDDARLKLQAVRTTLPVNHFAVDPFLGSPYMAEVTVTVKDSNGQPVNMVDGIQVSINPVGNTGGFTTLDDPETECKPEEDYAGCEFYIRMGQAPVDVVAGKATLFVHSLNFTGMTTLTVTTQDPVSGTTIAAALDFQIVESVLPTPSQLGLVTPIRPVYVQGSGGNDSGLMHIELRDAIQQPVPDPVAGTTAYNNYRLEIIGANPEETPRLNGINAAGVSVTGSQIDLRTTAGVGGANFIAGNGVGSFRVRLTADRADNNVDNGISDPVVLERSVVVSDGQLWDLEITQPSINSVTINPANGDIEIIDLDGTPVTVPVSPDGTYSVTVAVIATDRLGNPVLPGTLINFGLVDEPQDYGVGDFYMMGGDGDPEEGGTAFTAENGRFTVAGAGSGAGGGAGPGDTLLVMSEDVIGNRDLEAARIVTEVHNRRSLTVNYRFNHNDTTGQSVDYHGILPYLVGRAADGNIMATGSTDTIGVATTKMNYPISKLGKVAAIWAQGDGPVVAGQPKKVADVEFVRFAGIAGPSARLVVSPSVLPANTTLPVTICAYDALWAPMGGLSVDFNFLGLMGTGKVDGQALSGTVTNLTAFGSGCTTAVVETSGMLEGNGDATLVFAAAGMTGEVTFSFDTLVLVANPAAMIGGGTVVLQLFNSAGQPQQGFKIFGTCEGKDGATIFIQSGPGITDVNGKTTAMIHAINLNQIGSAGSGTCTFTTADESATAIVTLQGIDLCTLGTSPPIPGCPVEEPDLVTLIPVINSGTIVGSYTLLSSPAGVICSVPSGSPSSCTPTEFNEGAVVILTATGPNCSPSTPGCTGAGTADFLGWSGDCMAMPGNPMQATVNMSGNRTCTAIWN